MKKFAILFLLLCSVACGQAPTPGEVIDQKFEQQRIEIDQLKMGLLDLQTRVEALETATPDPPQSSTALVTASDMQLVGGFPSSASSD